MHRIISISIVAFLILSGTVNIQVKAQDHRQDDGKPMQKIQQFKKLRLLEKLNLDEETANKFLVKYDKWERQIMDLNHERSITIQELKLAIEKKAGDDELNGKLDSLVACTAKVEDARRAMFADLRSILTPKQATTLALFEAQFQKELHHALGKLEEHDDHPYMNQR